MLMPRTSRDGPKENPHVLMGWALRLIGRSVAFMVLSYPIGWDFARDDVLFSESHHPVGGEDQEREDEKGRGDLTKGIGVVVHGPIIPYPSELCTDLMRFFPATRNRW